MATWAIGDIQGCFSTLERLLVRAGFDASRDRLWLVGDLVNRGPRSLEVLRWARWLGDAATIVLGNHDLKLLAVASGVAKLRKSDTLDDVFAAPDHHELIEWLASRPLAHREGDRMMVHAGLLPQWTAGQAMELAGEASEWLRGPRRAEFLEALRGDIPTSWSKGLSGMTRAVVTTCALTRVRAVTKDGAMLADFSAEPDKIPRGASPWFDAPRRRSRDVRVVIGHWSALGLLVRPDVAALDTGCVWGRSLTALRLDDDHVIQEPARDGASQGWE